MSRQTEYIHGEIVLLTNAFSAQRDAFHERIDRALNGDSLCMLHGELHKVDRTSKCNSDVPAMEKRDGHRARARAREILESI